MAKKDYTAIRDAIVEACGGAANIANVTHCMTRLRVQLRDGSKLDQDDAKKIAGVLNLVVQNGEYQFVIGQDVPSLYEEFTKLDIATGGSVEDDAALAEDAKFTKGGMGEAILSFIGGTFSPVIPVLVAGGLTGAVLTLLTTFVPLITMLVTVPVTLIVLGPIGNTVGTWLSDGVLAIYRAVPPLAVAIVGLGTPWLVFFGMNNATYPVLFALMAEVGSDPLICTGMAPANVAVGGACLAAALIAKTVEERGVAVGAGVTALCGITEPGVYGVLFTERYPLIGAMIGGGIGGFVAGLLGMTQYTVSTPGFISFAAYISPDGTLTNLWISLGVMVLAVVLAFAATYVLGKRAQARVA